MNSKITVAQQYFNKHTYCQTPESLPPLIFLSRILCLEGLLCRLPSIMLISSSAKAGIQQLRYGHLMPLVRHGISETLVQICWIKLRSPYPDQQAARGRTRPLRPYKMSFSPTSMHLHSSLIHLMGYYLGSAPVHKASVRDSYFSKNDIQICFKGVYED